MTDYLKKLAETPIETYYPEDSRGKIESRQVALVARALLQLAEKYARLQAEHDLLREKVQGLETDCNIHHRRGW